MIDFTAGTCPRCGGWLYVDAQYPDDVRCDTCEYPETDAEADAATVRTAHGAEIAHNCAQGRVERVGERGTGAGVR